MSFARHARAAARASFRSHADVVTYQRSSDGVAHPYQGLHQKDLEVFGEGGHLIAISDAFHFLVEEVGSTVRGDLVIEANGAAWQISHEVLNDGYVVTVEVAPCVAGS